MDLRSLVRVDPGVGEVRGGMGVSELTPAELSRKLAREREKSTLHVGVLVEGADPIRTPDELAWWVERGVVAVGLSWWRHSRYAGGNGEPGRGLTDLGRAMIRAIDALEVVHDASHLSEKAFWELLKLTDRPIVATHSNCRAIVDPAGTNERHLTDDQIRAIGERGGVVGLNLLSSFLRPGIPFDSEQRASVDDCVRHVERVCEVMGRRTGVGLGSDMDGGFSSKGLPEGVDGPTKLEAIASALAARGWSESELQAFRINNWGRFFGRYPRRTV
jgi:membrane dipeptidase